MDATAHTNAANLEPLESGKTAEIAAIDPTELKVTSPEAPPAKLLVGGAAAAASRIDPVQLGEEETAVGAPPEPRISAMPDTLRDSGPPAAYPDINTPDTFRDAAVPIPRPKPKTATPVPQPPAPDPRAVAQPPLPRPPGRISILRAALWLFALLAVGIGVGVLVAELAA
jgi:hypothetical protein